MTALAALATAAASEAMDNSDSDRGSLNSGSSSVDSARAVAGARAYDTATIAIIPGLVVPLASVSTKGGSAALASAVASLEALADTMDTVLNRLDKAAASQQRRLNAVQRRICVCAGLVDRLRGRRTSTLLESKPRYPQLLPWKPRGGGVKTRAAGSKWGAQDSTNAPAATTSGAPSAIRTAHSGRFMRPRRSSPLPPVAPSSCSESSTDNSDDAVIERRQPLSYQPPMHTVPVVPALASAAARRGGSSGGVYSPIPPVNAAAAMRLAEWMPLETAFWDDEDSSAVVVEQGKRGGATATHMNSQGTFMNAASLQPSSSSSSALAWQPHCLPVMRGGQVMHSACEMPSALSALVSFPAHRIAYRHLAAPNRSSETNTNSATALEVRGALIHRDPYSLTGDAVTPRSTTTAWLHSTSTLDIQCDFTTPLQSQRYAFVPGGDAAAASSRALLRDMPRNLPLQHLATVRRWDQRDSNAKSRTRGSTDTEDDMDEDLEEHNDNDGPRQRRCASRRGPRDLETIAPGQRQRQWQARRRPSLSDSGTPSEGSGSDAEAAASARRRGRESGGARLTQQQARKVSTQPVAAEPSVPPTAPPSLAPPPPPGVTPSTTAPPPPPLPPGVTRSTTAPPPPPLPPAALLKGKTNPSMLPGGGGGGAPPRLPPPPPPPVQTKMVPPISSAPQPPPPPPPTSSQLPVGVKPGGAPVAAPAAPRAPPPPPPPQSQKSAVSALTSVLGERRRVLHSDDSSSSSGGEKMNGGADGGYADSSKSSSSSTSPRANLPPRKIA
ncbi:hypothetical protein CUR178_07973 [Leishmania enriettii]|uniref:WASH1 WAHD domain-containing protein n=1 Tax=Leishmania enriettii TaxID=5663 RepID=A0A836KTP4_LEIEN|nr:hypothetical protein CUR178_07973 [Leishmania enriettii]